MSLRLLPVKEEDLETACHIQTLAFDGNPDEADVFGSLENQLSPEFVAWHVSENKKALKEEGLSFVKVVNGDDDMIAIGKWKRAAADWVEKDENSDPPTWPKCANVENCNTFFVEGFHKQHIQFMQGKAHYYVMLLVTHPEHQGKGAGGLLLKAIAAQADADKLPCYLEASEKGLPIYVKYGYNLVGKSIVQFPNRESSSGLLIREPKQ